MKNNKTFPIFLSLSYVIGVGIGLYLITVVTWANMESAFYGFSRLASMGLGGFDCPVLMTNHETRTISLSISNNTDATIRPAVRTEISTAFVIQEFNEKLELAPGETRRLEWSVGPENIDLKYFIFAKTLVFSIYPAPNQETTCGIFVVNLPGSGRVVLLVLVTLSLLGMGWGVYAMNKSNISSDWIKKHVRSMAFLAIVIALGFIVSFNVGWIPSVLVLVVALFMVVILVGSLVMSESRKK